MARTVQARILERLEEDGARPAIAFVDGRGGFRWLSRAELHGRARRAAAALVELGLAPGDACLVASVDPSECALAVLAILLAGGVPLLVAPPAIQGVGSHLKDVVVDVAHRTRARVAVLARSLASDADELRAASPGLRIELGFERLLAAGGDAVPGETGERGTPGGVAVMQLTSGTTGFPRIARWEQERVLAALDGMAAGMALRADEVYLNWTPLYHDMGLVNNLLLCLTHGIPLALMSPLDVVRRPSLWLRALSATGATTTWSPNFGFALAAERVGADELDGVRLDGVRGFWNAAERVHLSTLQRFHARFRDLGVRWESLKANFGCVETIGGVTFTDPRGPLVAERVDLAELQASGVARLLGDAGGHAGDDGGDRGAPAAWIVGCGRPYPGADARAFDADGRALPDGVVGELGFRAPGRFAGYLDDPAETAHALRGERVFPGDLGYLRAGEVFWTGRACERINLAGKKLDPSELERVLFAVDGLRKGCFAAFGVEDAERGTEVLVVIAEVEDAAGADCARIAEEIRRGLAAQLALAVEELLLVPKGTLAKTSSGKRRHRRFRAAFLAGEIAPLHRSGAGRVGSSAGRARPTA